MVFFYIRSPQTTELTTDEFHLKNLVFTYKNYKCPQKSLKRCVILKDSTLFYVNPWTDAAKFLISLREEESRGSRLNLIGWLATSYVTLPDTEWVISPSGAYVTHFI